MIPKILQKFNAYVIQKWSESDLISKDIFDKYMTGCTVEEELTYMLEVRASNLCTFFCTYSSQSGEKKNFNAKNHKS